MNKINGLIKSVLIAYVVTVILLLLLSFGVYQFGLGKVFVSVGIWLIYAISNIVAGLVMAGIAGSKRVVWGSVSGFVYFLILVVCSVIFNNGNVDNWVDVAIGALICIAAGAVGGFFSPVENSKL